MQDAITFFSTIMVTITVVSSGFYLYVSAYDYRKWAYLGISISFLILGFGYALLQTNWYELGGTVLIIGIILVMIVSGIYIVYRAIDKFGQKHGFYLKKWQNNDNNKGDKQCKRLIASSRLRNP